MSKVDDTLYDVRVIESRIRRGQVTAEQYRAHLAALPDEAEHSEPVRLSFVSTFSDRRSR